MAKLNWIINQGDQNQDGKWNRDEARVALNFFAPGKDSAFFNYLWGKLNVDNDDFIVLDELKLLVKEAGAWSKMLGDAEAASIAAAEAKISAAQNMLNAARATAEPAAAQLAKATEVFAKAAEDNKQAKWAVYLKMNGADAASASEIVKADAALAARMEAEAAAIEYDDALKLL